MTPDLLDKKALADDSSNRQLSDVAASNQRLTFGLWYVKKRKVIIISLIWSLVVLVCLVWFYALGKLGFYLFNTFVDNKQNLNELRSSNLSAQIQEGRLDLTSQFTSAIGTDGQTADLVGLVNNPNLNYWASFNYSFLIGEQKIGPWPGFVLPQEKKYLTAFKQTVSGELGQLVVDNVTWHKVNRHDVPDWELYKQQRLNFIIKDLNFIDPRQSGLSENQSLASLSFTIDNETAYDYRNVNLIITAHSGAAVVGVYNYLLDGLDSRASQKIQINWPGTFTAVDHVEVMPEINILIGQP